MWIGLDDTDSRIGGCTTYVAFQFVQRVMEYNFSVIGYPRLVRLNPNVPWKTRGNGAIAIQISTSDEPYLQIGVYEGKPIQASRQKTSESIDIDQVKKIICSLLDEYAWFDENNTNPGIVISESLLPQELYWNAVHHIISLEDLIPRLDVLDVWYKGYKNRRGLIGASAALSWQGTTDKTYELITYRKRDKWGTKRLIDESSVQRMDVQYPSTFDNYDPINHHINIAPNSPCPILYGIRGEHPSVLPSCAAMIKTEPCDEWMIFVTNQATDDHLQTTSIDAVKPYESVIVRGTVSVKPTTLPGGHVIFSIRDSKQNSVECAAYEPTKQFRSIVRELEVGDEVEIFGGVRSHPITINMEKIYIHHVADVSKKVENPVCQHCGKHMKSRGRDHGFACKVCGTKETHAVCEKLQRTLSEGLYEVPVCARRHLSKPIKRMNELL